MFSVNVANKYFEQRVKSNIFLKWYILLVSKNKSKLETKLKKKVEEVCFNLASKYEYKIKKVKIILY